MIDSANMLSLSCCLLGLWGMLNAAQWIVSARKWRAGIALGWDLQGLRASRLYKGRWLSWFFSSPVFALIPVLQFCASLFLCLLPIGWTACAALIVIALTNTVLILRSSADGADKMAMVVTYGLLLQMLGAICVQPLLSFAGVLWVGGQLTVCYATSGVGKLILSDWRNAKAPKNALSSYSYGNQTTFMVLRYRAIAMMLAWGIMTVEALFPLALLAPLPVLMAALGLMALLHLSVAFAMGLNTYVFAFIAAYPSVLQLAQALRSFSWQ